jgi:23S rRNA (guanosine2251-2'-O)-methyltransferase
MKTNLLHSVIRECTQSKCKFRFPDTNYLQLNVQCPICQSKTEIVNLLDLSLDYRNNNNYWEDSSDFIAILDNIRSVYNVGALFRTSVGLGLKRIFLCGITPTPDHKNFTKSSLGSENEVVWGKSLNCVDQITTIKESGYKIISIENSDKAIPIQKLTKNNFSQKKVALVVGNEISGVDPDVLSISDSIISIPINGKNKSFNVTTAFGIALYHLSIIVTT